MKKVGIITYHFAQNYGAVLQCYALQTYLSQQGYAVTVFDFVSEKQQKNNDVVKHGASVKTAVANICLLPFTHSIRKKACPICRLLPKESSFDSAFFYRGIVGAIY